MGSLFDKLVILLMAALAVAAATPQAMSNLGEKKD
jgi:hypothetical protein